MSYFLQSLKEYLSKLIKKNFLRQINVYIFFIKLLFIPPTDSIAIYSEVIDIIRKVVNENNLSLGQNVFMSIEPKFSSRGSP